MPPDGPQSQDAHPGADDAALAALSRIRIILCDADGNLFPSEEPAFVASARVTNRFLSEHGCDRTYTPEELRTSTTGLNFRSTIVALAVANGIAVAPGVLAGKGPSQPVPVADGDGPMLDADGLERWVETEKSAVIEYLQNTLGPDPEVLEPLTLLAEHYGMAAVSSSADQRIAASFEATGLAGFFPPQRRFSAEDSLPIPTSKPDPAIYTYAGRQLGISSDQGVAVEDSVPGATSAVEAGFPTLGNLQFVPVDEQAERRIAFTDIGVLRVVESWSEVAALLAAARDAAVDAGTTSR
jgi:beta-phosphoglucomutase-like phosphatase (HAD superfamily)